MEKFTKTGLLILSVLCVAIVLFNMGTWIIISPRDISFEEAKVQFLNRYPDPIKDATKITIINIALGALAAFGFLRLRTSFILSRRRTLTSLGMLALFLTAWQIFSLM